MIICVGCLAGCSTGIVPPELPPVGLMMDGEVRVDARRNEARFQLSNRNNYDVICGPVYQRVVFDAPQSYLDVGEKISYGAEAYIARGSGITETITTSGFSNQIVGEVEVQFGTFGSGQLECRWADVIDYCAANMSDIDVKQTVLEAFKADNCLEVARTVSRPGYWRRADAIAEQQKRFLVRFARYEGYF